MEFFNKSLLKAAVMALALGASCSRPTMDWSANWAGRYPFPVGSESSARQLIARRGPLFKANQQDGLVDLTICFIALPGMTPAEIRPLGIMPEDVIWNANGVFENRDYGGSSVSLQKSGLTIANFINVDLRFGNNWKRFKLLPQVKSANLTIYSNLYDDKVSTFLKPISAGRAPKLKFGIISGNALSPLIRSAPAAPYEEHWLTQTGGLEYVVIGSQPLRNKNNLTQPSVAGGLSADFTESRQRFNK